MESTEPKPGESVPAHRSEETLSSRRLRTRSPISSVAPKKKARNCSSLFAMSAGTEIRAADAIGNCNPEQAREPDKWRSVDHGEIASRHGISKFRVAPAQPQEVRIGGGDVAAARFSDAGYDILFGLLERDDVTEQTHAESRSGEIRRGWSLDTRRGRTCPGTEG